MRFIAALAVACTGVLVSLPSLANKNTYKFERRYQEGETYGYRLTVDEYINGKWKGTSVGESRHIVTLAGVPHETITWSKLSKSTPTESKELNHEAKAVPAYEFSLVTGWEFKPMPLSVPGMIGMVTDLVTHLVSVSPANGSQNVLSPRDPAFTNPKIQRGVWTFGDYVPHGEVCLQVSVRLKKLTPTIATYETSYTPPETACLGFGKYPEWMKQPTVGNTPNNWINIQGKSANGYRAINWGHEQFTVTLNVDRSTGRILSGRMKNLVRKISLSNCDLNMENCESRENETTVRYLRLDPIN